MAARFGPRTAVQMVRDTARMPAQKRICQGMSADKAHWFCKSPMESMTGKGLDPLPPLQSRAYAAEHTQNAVKFRK